MVTTALLTRQIVQRRIPTSDSFSCFTMLLNRKKLSLSLKDDLFLMELEAAGGGQGIGFSGEVEGNLEDDMNNQLYVDTLYFPLNV